MREGWLVTIVSVNNKGKIHKTSFMEYGSLVDCSRIMLSLRTKKGYKLDSFEIIRSRTLV